MDMAYTNSAATLAIGRTRASGFKRVLRFPEASENFDALDDCFEDISIPEDGGVALVFHRFDAYVKTAGATRTHSGRTHAEIILDIIAIRPRCFCLPASVSFFWSKAMIQNSDLST
jgi:dTDP-4-amino-4,6-dideoxygalactose transaminase